MSPTPEQRAERIVEQNFGLALWRPGNARTAEREIARAIRAAENAALERAARTVDGREGPYVGPHTRTTIALIRSLKTRAPRARMEK